MGQKVNPIGIRLGITRDWSSRWFADSKNFASYIYTDWVVREFLKKKLAEASVSRIHIERAFFPYLLHDEHLTGRITSAVPTASRFSVWRRR